MTVLVFGGLLAAQGAVGKNERLWTTDDPDLRALEKLGLRAKRAMEAFVLRPRLADGFEDVCTGCRIGESRRVMLASMKLDRVQAMGRQEKLVQEKPVQEKPVQEKLAREKLGAPAPEAAVAADVPRAQVSSTPHVRKRRLSARLTWRQRLARRMRRLKPGHRYVIPRRAPVLAGQAPAGGQVSPAAMDPVQRHSSQVDQTLVRALMVK